MKSTLPLTLLIAVFVTACAEPSGDSDNADSETASAVVDSAMLRPDPENPVNDELSVPLGWNYRFDNSDAEISVGADADSFDVFFVSMTPGWHMTTTSAAGIFWHPSSTAEGSFTATWGAYLFPPGQRNEGFGLLFGGSDLGGPNQSYLYFLIRRSGEYLVKRRVGAETETLAGWTADDAILPYTDETEDTIHNTLAVQVDDENILFFVNETNVYTMPKGDLVTDGVVGWRVNHGLNLHIDAFDVEMGM